MLRDVNKSRTARTDGNTNRRSNVYNSRDVSNSRKSNNSRDASNSKNTKKHWRHQLQKCITSMAVGATSKAAVLATARTPGTPTAVRKTSIAGPTKLQERKHSKDSRDVTSSYRIATPGLGCPRNKQK